MDTVIAVAGFRLLREGIMASKADLNRLGVLNLAVLECNRPGTGCGYRKVCVASLSFGSGTPADQNGRPAKSEVVTPWSSEIPWFSSWLKHNYSL